MPSNDPISARRRQSRGLYNIREVAAMIGESYHTLYWHVKRGYIARPAQGPGKRKYYDAIDIERIKKYWLNPEADLGDSK